MEGFGLFVGFAVATMIFVNCDPDVYFEDVERAVEICSVHNGVKRIETNVLRGFVAGQCNDGMRFSKVFHREEK